MLAINSRAAKFKQVFQHFEVVILSSNPKENRMAMTAEQFSVGYDDLVKQVAEIIGDADIVEGCLFPTLADMIKLEFLNQPHDPVKLENDFLQLLRGTFYKIGMSEQDVAAAMAEIDRRIKEARSSVERHADN